MANSENLKPPINKRSTSEQREIRQKGGIKSGEARRARKTLKEELLLLLESGDTQSKISLALIKKALKGNIKAFEVIRDTIGEKPVDKQLTVEGTKEDLEVVIDKEGIQAEIEKTRMLADE